MLLAPAGRLMRWFRWLWHAALFWKAVPGRDAPVDVTAGTALLSDTPSKDGDAASSDDKSLQHIRQLLGPAGAGGDTGSKPRVPMYSSPHNRLRVHLKVPSPAEPEDLGTSADFTQRLATELARNGYSLAGVAVRRGCIELAVDLVMLPRAGLPVHDSAFEGQEQHPCTLPLQAMLRALDLPLGSVVTAFWAGQALQFRHTPAADDGADGLWLCVNDAEPDAADEDDAAATHAAEAAATAELARPCIDAIRPLCLPVAAAPEDGGALHVAGSPPTAPPPLRIELQGRNLTAAGVAFAARSMHGYLTTTASPLADGSEGVELLITSPFGGLSHPGLLHIECRDASAVVLACRPVLLADPALAAEVGAALEADAARALQLGNHALRSLDELLSDIGAWTEYVCARQRDAATVAAAAATAPAPQQHQQQEVADSAESVLRTSLLSPHYRQVMQAVSEQLLAEALRRGWPCLVDSLSANVATLGKAPSPPLAGCFAPWTAATALPPALATTPTPVAAASGDTFAVAAAAATGAPLPGGGDMRCALHALAFSPPELMQALIAAGLPVMLFLVAVFYTHADKLSTFVLPPLAERVRMRYSLPPMLLHVAACALSFVRLGMFGGELLPCAVHSALGIVLWAPCSVAVELDDRHCFLRQSR